jgi:hypothetical protein
LPSGEQWISSTPAKADAWAKHRAKIRHIHDYELTGAQIELDQLAVRFGQAEWRDLSNEEQTIKIILDLRIDIDDFLVKGAPEGRTVRRSTSACIFVSEQAVPDLDTKRSRF